MLDFSKVVNFGNLPLVPAMALNMTQAIWEDMSVKDRQEGITALRNDIDKMTAPEWIEEHIEESELEAHSAEMIEMSKAIAHMEEHLND